jgi:hypothetical protein
MVSRMPRTRALRAAPPTLTRRRGRPRVHRESWTKINVILFNRQLVFLRQFAGAIRRTTGKSLNRAQIIRALIDALRDCRSKITFAQSEADLTRTLARKLNGD